MAPTLIVLLAGVLRFYNLAHPNAIVFDETYYAKDAYSYVHYGYELSWTKDANASFVAGHPRVSCRTRRSTWCIRRWANG